MHDAAHSQQLLKLQNSLKDAMTLFNTLKNDLAVLNEKVDNYVKPSLNKGKAVDVAGSASAQPTKPPATQKRTHSDVDPSSSDSSSNNLGPQLVKEVSGFGSSLGRLERMFLNMSSALGLNGELPSNSLGGEDLEEEEDDDIEFDEAVQDQDEELNF